MDDIPVIKPIGTLCAVDENGYFINQADFSKVKSPFLEVVRDAVGYYQDAFREQLHSIYLRGTVARGVAIAGTADLDLILLVHENLQETDRERSLQEIHTRLEQDHPCVDGIETVVCTIEEIQDTSTFSMVAFLLKTHSACVHGTDLSHKLPNYSCDSDLAKDQLLRYLENLQVIRDELGQPEYEAADTRNDCRWIMKSLIRGGLALVMDVERVYTRDLYPCYQLFAKHFEDQKSQMEQALELAIEPTSDATILLDFLSNFGSWMEEQARDWLNSNPTVDSL